MQLKVLIVGAGITGCSIAALLARAAPSNCELLIKICDKGRGAGGRMSTSRSGIEGGSSADLGAQYISSSPADYDQHRLLYTELEKEQLLRPMTVQIVGERDYAKGTRHFVTPFGSSSLARHFLVSSEAEVRFSTRVSSLLLSNENPNRWKAQCEESELEDSYDCVILTPPVPQSLDLCNNVRHLFDTKLLENLENVQYSSRYAIALYFSPEQNVTLPWAAKYFYDDPCVRYVAVDNIKRSADANGSAIVVHSSVPWGLEHLELPVEEVESLIMQHVTRVLPELPVPGAVKLQRWRYSQVFKGFPRSPGCVVAHREPLLLLAGDAFSGSSKFDQCLHSAKTAVSQVSETFFS